jgi:hypothetical protein
MTNFFYSVGYGLEKVHPVMIAYQCDRWNEGERELLGSFLGHSRSSSLGGYDTTPQPGTGTASI